MPTGRSLYHQCNWWWHFLPRVSQVRTVQRSSLNRYIKFRQALNSWLAVGRSWYNLYFIYRFHFALYSLCSGYKGGAGDEWGVAAGWWQSLKEATVMAELRMCWESGSSLGGNETPSQRNGWPWGWASDDRLLWDFLIEFISYSLDYVLYKTGKP